MPIAKDCPFSSGRTPDALQPAPQARALSSFIVPNAQGWVRLKKLWP